MKAADVKNVAVVGAGIMGHGIAQTFALGGFDVTLNDMDQEVLENAFDRIRANLRSFVQEDIISPDDVEPALARIHLAPELAQAVKRADLVIEAVVEDIEAKRDVFKRLDSLCPPEAVLASNSSSLLISDFASGTNREDRVVLTHWFNPPHIVPTVEVIKGHKTSDETADLLYELLEKVGKQPVRILKEIPGYLVNRIQMAMLREVWSLWEQGVATAEDIDRAVKGSFGFRLASIGPLLTNDLGGNDTNYRVARYLLPLINSSQEPPDGLRKMVEAGDLGTKTGRGFFQHNQDEWQGIIAQRDREFLKRLKCLYLAGGKRGGMA
ncbi:MAG: 3-hydroxyacyl-CoA dehydrogenase family protein [bacterium]